MRSFTPATSANRGIAPVVAVALLIGIVVVLVSIIGFLVLENQLGDPPEPSARIVFHQEPVNGSTYTVTANHVAGDTLNAARVTVVIIDTSGDGEDTGNFSASMAAGDTQVITSSVESGDIIRLVWAPPTDPTSKIIAEYTVK